MNNVLNYGCKIIKNALIANRLLIYNSKMDKNSF